MQRFSFTNLQLIAVQEREKFQRMSVSKYAGLLSSWESNFVTGYGASLVLHKSSMFGNLHNSSMASHLLQVGDHQKCPTMWPGVSISPVSWF